MNELLLTIFSAAFLATVIRTSTPLLLATLGGLIADLSGAEHVGRIHVAEALSYRRQPPRN